jgi:lysophospholipase L1-like esterase
MYIVCFGDSICHGYGVPPGEEWVALLADALNAAFGAVRVRNAGVSGETAQDGLRRLHNEFAPDMPETPDVFYLQFGLNDAWIDLYDSGHYAGIMDEIVYRAFDGGAKNVIVAGNHPVWPAGDFAACGYPARVREYNRALRERFAGPAPRTAFADIERLWRENESAAWRAWLLEDGVHLSRQGNRAYAGMLLPVFTDILRG